MKDFLFVPLHPKVFAGKRVKGAPNPHFLFCKSVNILDHYTIIQLSFSVSYDNHVT